MSHDPELDDVFDKFESDEWNESRTLKEGFVLMSVFELANFMGCNQFTLKDGDYTVSIKVENALSN